MVYKAKTITGAQARVRQLENSLRETRRVYEEICERKDTDAIKAEQQAIDRGLVLGAIITGKARWEPYSGSTNRGELCFGGIRHGADLDVYNCPVLSDTVRTALNQHLRK